MARRRLWLAGPVRRDPAGDRAVETSGRSGRDRMAADPRRDRRAVADPGCRPELSSGPGEPALTAAAQLPGRVPVAVSTAPATASDDPLQLGVGDDERRAEQDRVAVDAVRVARARVDEHARVAGRPDDRLRDARRRAGTARRVSRSATSSTPTISPRPRISPRCGWLARRSWSRARAARPSPGSPRRGPRLEDPEDLARRPRRRRARASR